MSHALSIRNAKVEDLPAILDIYNHYVRETAFTFDIEPVNLVARTKWYEQFSDNGAHQLLVALKAGAIVGYTHSTIFRPKLAYAGSVETTIYLIPGAEGDGVGGKLYGELMKQISLSGVHRAYAIIAMPSEASVALHERLDFTKLHTLSEVGYKFGRFWDTLWMERRF